MTHFGDITKIRGADVPPVDAVIGGSPCQGLSIAGRRAGLADERSGLFMEQIRVIKEMRRSHGKPRWMVWENVTYVLKHINDVMNRNQLCKVLSPKSSKTEQIALFRCA